MVSRRGFLKRMVAAVVGTAAAVYCPSVIREILETEELSRELNREQIIAKALETDEGRKALAMAMVEPIRRSLEQQVLGCRIPDSVWEKWQERRDET